MSSPYTPPRHIPISESSVFPVGSTRPSPALSLLAAQPASVAPVSVVSPTVVTAVCSLLHCSAPRAHPYPPRIYINNLPSGETEYSETINVVQAPGHGYFDCDVDHQCPSPVFTASAVADWLRTSPLTERALLAEALTIPESEIVQTVSAEPRQSGGMLLVNTTPIPLMFRIDAQGRFRLAWIGGETAFIRQSHHRAPSVRELLIPPGDSRTLVGNPGGPRFADGVWGVVTVSHAFS